jgi:hypothetical protein
MHYTDLSINKDDKMSLSLLYQIRERSNGTLDNTR